MKKLKWIILSLVVLLTVGGIGGGLMLKSWLAGVLTRESFVRQIESQWNCRADLGDLTVSLWSTPARIELKSLVLSKRDIDANAGTAIANRKPVASGATLAGAETLVLEADLTELVHRRLHVKRLTISGLRLRNDVSEERGNLLAVLFSKPMALGQTGTEPAKPLPSEVVADIKPDRSLPPPPNAPPAITAAPEATSPRASEAPASEMVAAPAPEKKPTHKPAFQASELGLSVIIDEARIENGSFHENNHLVRTGTDISDLNLTITEVDIDPNDLAKHNQCKVVLSARIQSRGRAKIKEVTQDVKVADFTFKASSTLQPLSVLTGELEPAGMLDLTLKKGSIFGGTMTIGDLAGKDKGFQNMIKNSGIDVSSVLVGGELQEEMTTTVKLGGPRIEFAKDAILLFPEYTITIGTSSWLNGAEDDHEMQLKLMPGDKLSKTLLEGAQAKGGDMVVKLAHELFNDGQGHLVFDIVASGHLSKPKMEFGGKVGALLNLFKGFGK